MTQLDQRILTFIHVAHEVRSPDHRSASEFATEFGASDEVTESTNRLLGLGHINVGSGAWEGQEFRATSFWITAAGVDAIEG